MATSVLVIYAGGTIGMQPSSQGYAPATGLEASLRSGLQDSGIAFDWLEIDPLIDSANAQPSDWLRLARIITECEQDYCGFVILHGTDTLAYTASALSFMLGALDKPVVLTGSQIPLRQPRSDGWLNVTNSLILAAAGAVHEVLICFQHKILRGNRARKLHSQAMAAFDSPCYPALIEMGITPNWHLDSGLTLEVNPALDRKLVQMMDDTAVGMLMLYPGMHRQACQALLEQANLGALVVMSFGAGNPPTSPQGPMSSLKALVDRGVLVVNISQCISGGVEQGSYASGAEFNRIGVLSGRDMTPEAAFTKLHWLLANKIEIETARQLIAMPLAGELTL